MADAKQAEVKPSRRKRTLVSVYPTYRLVLSVDLKELRQLENGRFREVTMEPQKALEFVNHYATLDLSDSEATMIQERPNYWFGFMLLEDLAKMRDNAEAQYEGFIRTAMRRSEISGITLKFSRMDLEKRMRAEVRTAA